jgi:N-acetylmuramoyl-L-alanine amidase
MYTWKRNIAVTRFTQFPCVLVEAGYMMHPEDNWYIFHPRGQEDFARAMKEGIKEYFLSCDENNNGER